MTLLISKFNIPKLTAACIVHAIQATVLNLTYNLAFLNQYSAIVMPIDPFGLPHFKGPQTIRASLGSLFKNQNKSTPGRHKRTNIVLYFSF